MTQEFAGKSAIVTGASRGIGRAVAQMLAARGAKVVVVARDAAGIEETASAIAAQTGMPCVGLAGDAARATTAEAAVARAVNAFGRLDILANIAGWYPTARVEDTSDEDFATTIASNLGASFAMCRAAAPALRAAGGVIVNMSSTAARFPTPGLAAYSAAKAGVEAFTRSLAAELAPAVRVNAVAAGPTWTETVRDLMEQDSTGAVQAVTASLPLGRLAEAEEIAEAVLFLASSRAAVVTGQILYANCGGHMA
ncbi:SDR family NAD(P)-dependent oxidoreductase [Novosphingobium rosa]|uniref:SDR family NAD(P)-dependent oxidoreductase n=1 Tax=Novosphingobium rosa TaxID=76978 RepID=UPI000A0613C5|nr:SDR family oxidoreductase [Novosphingobium rosa]